MITWQKNSLEREGGRKEPAQFCLNIYQTKAEILVIWLQNTKLPSVSCNLRLLGTEQVLGFFPGIPQLILLVGAENNVSSTGPCFSMCILLWEPLASFDIASHPSVPYFSAHHASRVLRGKAFYARVEAT